MEKYTSSPTTLAKRLWLKSLIDSLMANGFKKTQIASKLNVTPQRLTNILNGTNTISDNVIDSFVAAFGLGQVILKTENDLSSPVKEIDQDNKESIIDRLDRYLLLCGISEEQATINARLDGDFLRRVREEQRDLTPQEAQVFLRVFIDLNEEWLLSGQGEMRNGNTLPIENRKQPMARILELLHEEGITLEEFAQAVNSRAVLFNNAAKWPSDSRNLILGNEKAIRGWVDAFCSVFPKYSKFWILTGKTSKYNYPVREEE